MIQLKERGRGAYGVVYEMQHQETGTIMAVKVPTVQCHLCISHSYDVVYADFHVTITKLMRHNYLACLLMSTKQYSVFGSTEKHLE